MARVSSVGTQRDRVSSLSAVIRDHRMAMGSSSRRDQLLGLNSPPDGNAFDEEFKEEDVWASTELSSNSARTGLVSSPPDSTSTVNIVINSGNAETGGRRWLGVESGLGAISALPRNTRGVGRVTSASRMIPHMVSSSENGRKAGVMHQSAPVQVPDWSRILGRRSKKDKEGFNRGGGEEEVEDDEEEEMSVEKLPPHELVARSQVTTFSVFEGAGRTLKGRDLSRVRNAVLKQTGFLQ